MKKIRSFLALSLNFVIDYYVFLFYSSIIFNKKSHKLLALITYNYHTIEKGLSMQDIRYKFGINKVRTLISRISNYIKLGYDTTDTQFIAGCNVLLKYYDLHQDNNIDISQYFPRNDYNKLLKYRYDEVGGTIQHDCNNYFSKSDNNYEEFSKSRHSIRSFSDRPVETTKIIESIEIAKYCPSACNRQSSKVYFIDNPYKVKKILQTQGGTNATIPHINQLLVISSDRGFFFTSGERNQHLIDGGIFLESMLLSLHHLKIATCPLHWSLNYWKEKSVKRMLSLSKSEKIIALIAIGYIDNQFKTPASQRKNIQELFHTIN